MIKKFWLDVQDDLLHGRLGLMIYLGLYIFTRVVHIGTSESPGYYAPTFVICLLGFITVAIVLWVGRANRTKDQSKLLFVLFCITLLCTAIYAYRVLKRI